MDEGVVATTPTSFFKLQQEGGGVLKISRLSETASMLVHCWNLNRMLVFEGFFHLNNATV